ncbi:class D beta-lactamase [Shinella sp. H4-D48]|uniref:class D beta-lactamase n=1 Tax=Shinella sp. H4-D48 TaxID=2925841 RepID=UPI001F52D3D9|nr:class D beta-lactamase [Shinella sp. H4-D48]UNK39098.1 class D beta-lactamase [Shinella sp. H4-D48]
MDIRLFAAGALLAASLCTPAEARIICTIVTDAADGAVILEKGDCKTRVTPASTFKVPLAVMGYDAGFLENAEEPVLPFMKGYPDWGGDNWRQPTTPKRWMEFSVVWYSQRITEFLGYEQLRDYADALGYGNGDMTGDPGKDNGLERAWIASSLKISPREQVAFLAKLVNHELPVSANAMDAAMEIVEGKDIAGGWHAQGKTGMAYPRKADGSFDYAKPWGWYVGWARRDDRTVVFARLLQDEKKEEPRTSLRARDGILAELPAILAKN